MKCWHCPHFYIIMWEILWQPVKCKVTSHYGMYFGTESVLYTQYSIKIFTFNMFFSSCACIWMCGHVSVYKHESIVFVFWIIYVCVLIFVSLVSKSLSFFLSPSHFLFLFQFLHHFTVLKAPNLPLQNMPDCRNHTYNMHLEQFCCYFQYFITLMPISYTHM